MVDLVTLFDKLKLEGGGGRGGGCLATICGVRGHTKHLECEFFSFYTKS